MVNEIKNDSGIKDGAAKPVTQRVWDNDVVARAEAMTTTIDKVEIPPKEYVYSPYFPIGHVTMISAEPGVGKSKFIDSVAAMVTLGKPLCGIPCGRPGYVIVFGGEDNQEEHRATMEAMGADQLQSRVLSDKEMSLELQSKHPITFNSQEVEYLIDMCRPSMVVFDTYNRYFPGGDPNKTEDVRAADASLRMLAKRYNTSIVTINHNGKGHDGNLQYKAMGSTTIMGDVRSAMAIVRDPECEDENIVIHVKSNNRYGNSIRYKVVGIPGNEDYAKVEFLGVEYYTERTYYAAKKRAEKAVTKQQITDEDPIVKTIVTLADDNNGKLRVSRGQLYQAVAVVTGESHDVKFDAICKTYGEWLEERKGISLTRKENQKLRPFMIGGKMYQPDIDKSRVLCIYSTNTPTL